jgi:hypothetical protein
MVVHICNPSYSGARGRGISSLRPAQGKFGIPVSKIETKGLGMWLKG